MSNKIFNFRVRAQSVASSGIGVSNFAVQNVAGYTSFNDVVNTSTGNEERFTYRITDNGSSSLYEYGIGYLTSLGGGQYNFVRETIINSSQGNLNKTNFTGQLVVDMMANHPNFVNSERINSNAVLNNISTTYFIDATGNLTLSLPAIITDSVLIGFTITSLSGVQNERTDAVTISASGSDTIDGTGAYTLSKKNDFIRIISDVDNGNWIVLDPISDAAASSGPNGAVQLADDGILGYSNGLFYNDDALFIGGDDVASATIKLGAESSTIFNVRSGSLDFSVHSNGVPNTLFVDGSANSVGINTNTPSDLLNIRTTGIEGLTISTTTSGSIPTITLQNNDPDFSEGTDIGRINFVANNSVSGSIVYGQLLAEAVDTTSTSEEGEVHVLVNNNGTLQLVSKLSYDDIQIGPNNSISGGIIIGANNTNQGDNILLGYYSTNCGVSSISVGHSNTIASGSYAGAIGSHHAVTGSNIWLFGGSGFDVTGINSTYLISNINNYIKLKHDQQQRVGIYVDTTGTDFAIVNTRVSVTGVKHKQNFLFNNSIGKTVTGVSYGIEVLSPVSSGENTKFFISVLESGTPKDVFSISADNVNISNISGFPNAILIGSNLDISGTGANITVVGLSNTITNNSGEITVIGYNNELTSSGNDHIVSVGNSNTVDENYSTTIGTLNRNSGLYSAVVGYNNGAYGENIAVIGVNNDVSGNNASVIGYQNNIDNNGVYIIGQGNTSAYSGVHILGNNVVATGNNITYIKNNTIVITGNYITFDTTGIVNFNGTTTLNGSTLISSGDNISFFTNDSNYLASGDNISYLTNDSNYISSGDNISLLNNNSKYVASGNNITLLTNNAGYLISGTDNVSSLNNDAGYITSSGYANPRLTFEISVTGANTFIFSGAGTQGAGIDENPDIYLYRGFTYNFVHNRAVYPFQIQYLGNPYNSGLTNNTGVISGTISWSVRHDTHSSGIYYINSNNPLLASGNIYVV